VPQVLKAIRTKSVGDLSILQILILTAGLILWLSYGYALRNPVIVAANILPLGCNICLLRLKLATTTKSQHETATRIAL
jgi:MtN3 and saliva related transmembrane protein